MRIENLLKVKDQSFDVVVSDGTSGHRLYCDGSIIAIADQMELDKDGPSADKMAVKSHQLWFLSEDQPKAALLTDLGLFGSFQTKYLRKFAGESFETYIDERFVRCFRADAEFRSRGPEKQQIEVFEAGQMVGIIMPCDVKVQSPPIPFLEDAVLYHDCPDEDD